MKMPNLKLRLPSFNFRTPSNLALPVLFALLILSIVVMFGAFGYAYIQNSNNTAYLSSISEQKLLSQRIATASLDAASGNDQAFIDLTGYHDRYQTAINILKLGKGAGLPPLPDSYAAEFANLEEVWQEYKINVDSIVTNRETVGVITGYIRSVNRVLPRLGSLADDVASILVNAGADVQTVSIASRQSLFIQRAENNLNLMLTGSEDAVTATDQFGKDFSFYARIVDGLIKGSTVLNIKKVTVAEAQNKLAEQKTIYSKIRKNVSSILDESVQLFEIKDAAAGIQQVSPELLEAGILIEDALTKSNQELLNVVLIGVAAGVMAIIIIALSVVTMFRGAKRRAEESAMLNRRNQEAILRLLDEMTHLADGDLTAHATVTEDITGAIADSVNFSIDALRTLVETINSTVVQVSSSSEETQSIANRLAQASNKQAAEITSTTAAISNMASTMDEMSKRALNSSEVALKSVEIANKGAETVRRNIEGMDAIRDTIQETSKRIKRLGESSQQIGEIVALITDIADRTNILALNAAIQASSAGDAGRGFAVVADEVQRLAERAGDATKQISALVETIQADTNEAVNSMEQSTAGVVSGAKLAEDAGSALNEIRSVSQKLADLIQNISKDAREQANAAISISESMNVIQQITKETSEGTNTTATSIGNLTDLANELRKSVAGFKLPDANGVQAVS